MTSENTYQKAALFLGCEVAAIKAAAHVEGGGVGFYPDGKIILKFEGHLFGAFTHHRFDASHPTLSYLHWTEKFSEFGEAAYNRFNQAFALDSNAAMLATSFGAFQILGENYSSCGFPSVGSFVTGLKASIDSQLDAYCHYIKTQGLAKYLIAKDWAGYALRYNGRAYKANSYDTKMETAYQMYSKEAVTA